MPAEWINALIGGAFIGIAVSVMLLFNGRVTGICGIINGILKPEKNEVLWRVLFVLGLFLGGLVLREFIKDVFISTISTDIVHLVIAGLLVGFGTSLGSGCTSGHGVCGISRLSIRSIVATIFFMVAGILAVVLFRYLGVLS